MALGLLAVLVTACVAGENPQVEAGQAGFFIGLWHGVIAPFSFVVSLFIDNVSIYEVNNNGNWYDFGFVIGAGVLFGGGASARN